MSLRASRLEVPQKIKQSTEHGGVKGQKEAEGSSENKNLPTAGGRGIKEMHKN